MHQFAVLYISAVAGLLTEYGFGTLKSFATAARWYDAAAKQVRGSWAAC